MTYEANQIKLSQYAVDTTKLKTALAAPNLTGLSQFDHLFLSTVPMVDLYEDDDQIYITDFPEVAPPIDADTQTASRAILLTGAAGTGKRTAEKYFGERLYAYIAEQIADQIDDAPEEEAIKALLLYYAISPDDLLVRDKAQSCQQIQALFQQMIDHAKASVGHILYFSFGNVTKILRRKKTARCFAACVASLIQTPNLTCLLTCTYDGDASDLTERQKDPFILEVLTPPDATRRSEYFYLFRTQHPHIDLIPDDDTLAALTDGFTFRMLTRLTERIMIQVKGSLIYDAGYTQEAYMAFVKGPVSSEQQVKISSDDVERYAAMIRNSAYVPKQQPATAFSFPPGIFAQAVPAALTAEPQKAEPVIEDPGQKKPDTIAELEDVSKKIWHPVHGSHPEQKKPAHPKPE